MVSPLVKYRKAPLEVKAAFWFTVCNGLQQGAVFFTMPFFTRLMSSWQYGIVTVYNSWLAIVLAIVCLNVYGGCFNKMMMIYEDRRPELASSMFGLITTLCAAALAVSLALSWAFAALFGLDESFVPVLMLNVFATGGFTLWSVYRRFEYKYKQLLVGTVLFVVLAACVSIACVAFDGDDSSRAFVRVASNVAVILPITLVLGAGLLCRGKAFFRAEMWRYALRFVLPLLPHYLSMIALGQIGRLFIAYYCGESQAAYFGVCYQLSIAMVVIITAVMGAVVPWMYARMKARDYEGMAAVFNAITLGVALANVALSLLAPEIIALFAPEEYLQAASLIPLMAASTFFIYLYNMYVNVEFYYEKRLAVSVISVIAALVDAGLCAWLIPTFGYVTAAVAMLASYALMGVGHAVLATRICQRESISMFDSKVIWGLGAALLLLCLGVAAIYGIAPVVRYVLVAVLVVVAFALRNKARSLLGEIRGWHD